MAQVKTELVLVLCCWQGEWQGEWQMANGIPVFFVFLETQGKNLSPVTQGHFIISFCERITTSPGVVCELGIVGPTVSRPPLGRGPAIEAL